MTTDRLEAKVGTHLSSLCLEKSGRPTGSKANQAATRFFADVVASFGFETQCPSFACIHWTSDGARLAVNGAAFEAPASPYSLSCRVDAPLAIVSTVEELERVELAHRIALLRGDIAREQLMPKNFPFYNPESHRRIVQLLETMKPLAIVTATARNPMMAGGLYPFPLIEDGDFDIPSVYLTEEEGARLAEYEGRLVSLESRANRTHSTACNVLARKGAHRDRRVVVCAHIDAKIGTPGALDNASGVTVLLLLAELLANYSRRLGIELLAMNGEDYYSAPGEQRYLAENANRFGEIVLGINMDGEGYREGKVAYSLYGCPADIAGPIQRVFSSSATFVQGEPWYQGDHSLFVMNERPALAITSERIMELMGEIVHTFRDTPEMTDPVRLVATATALRDLIQHLDQ